MQVAPEFQQDPAALSMLYVQAPGGKLDPAVGGRHDPADRRAAVDQPHRPAAVGDAVVQPRSRASRSATRVARVAAAGARDAARHGDRDSFQGTAQAFQDSMRGLGWILRARDLRHLRRARHPLRELHPPDHDSLGPAVGRLRRAADAAHLQAGPRHLRVRRRHHARRPREEERHHDDRLRDRARDASARSAPPTRSTKPASSASARS